MTDKKVPDGWQTVKFGEIARQISKRVEPSETELEVYVGLEHLDPDSLKIKRHGIPSDVKGQKLLVQKGQIIFGKRRAYQRKVAIADWDCICSAHAMVLEAIPGKILPEFLPFFMQSDVFMNRAVVISEGSLSPTIKWKVLENQEFSFPTISMQKNLIDNLRKTKGIVEAEDAFIESSIKLESVIVKDFLNKNSGELIELTGQELLDKGYITLLQDGNHGSQYPRKNEFSTQGLPYLSAQHIDDLGNIHIEDCPKIPENRAEKLRIKPAKGGDVILTHNATIGRVAILDEGLGTVIGSTSTTYYRVNPDLLSATYLALFMRSSFFQSQLNRIMRQSTRNQVPITAQKKLKFLMPPKEIQLKLTTCQELFEFKKPLIKNSIRKKLSKSLESKLLGVT